MAKKPLTLYSKPNCTQCDMTARLLDAKGLQYTVVDMMQDEEALHRVKQLGYMAAPVVETPSGDHWSGFRPDKIHELVA